MLTNSCPPAALTVHERERPGQPEAPEIDGRDAGGCAPEEAVGLADIAARDRRNGPHQIDEGRTALLLQRLVGDDVHRQGGVFGCAPDQGTGNHHFLDLIVSNLCRALSGGLGRHTEAKGDRQSRAGIEVQAPGHCFRFPLLAA